jgi:hypothetical protein
MSATTEKDKPGTPLGPTVANADVTGAGKEFEPTEFDTILPELSSGGTVLVGKEEFILKSRSGETGVNCRVKPIRLREALKIGRVLTGSTRPLDLYAMLRPIMEADNDNQQAAAFYAAMVQMLVTVPHSEDEFVDLLKTVTEPTDKMETEEFGLFVRYMNNPTMEDTIWLMYQAFVNERPHAMRLGKLLMSIAPARFRGANENPENGTPSPGPQSST